MGDFSVYSGSYYLKGALAGGLCCSITHGAACPIDVVKTRMQLDPVKYNKGMIDGFKQVIKNEGAGALATGLGPTAGGYLFQGWWKFGGFEFFKVNLAKSYGDKAAWDKRFMLNTIAAASAEFIADIFLCPFEATRIRQVSDPVYAKMSMPGAAGAMVKAEGLIPAMYSGFVPMLFKQIPYTIAKFVVQDFAQESIYRMTYPNRDCSKGTKFGISLTSGVIAGVAAANLSPCGHAALEDQQGWRGRRGEHVRAHGSYRSVGWPCEAMPGGIASALRDDRRYHRRAVWHLRHVAPIHGGGEVPFP